MDEEKLMEEYESRKDGMDAYYKSIEGQAEFANSRTEWVDLTETQQATWILQAQSKVKDMRENKSLTERAIIAYNDHARAWNLYHTYDELEEERQREWIQRMADEASMSPLELLAYEVYVDQVAQSRQDSQNYDIPMNNWSRFSEGTKQRWLNIVSPNAVGASSYTMFDGDENSVVDNLKWKLLCACALENGERVLNGDTGCKLGHTFGNVATKYKIMKKPTYVAYDESDIESIARKALVMMAKRKSSTTLCMITFIRDSGVNVGGSFIRYDELLSDWEWSNGDVCGKESI